MVQEEKNTHPHPSHTHPLSHAHTPCTFTFLSHTHTPSAHTAVSTQPLHRTHTGSQSIHRSTHIQVYILHTHPHTNTHTHTKPPVGHSLQEMTLDLHYSTNMMMMEMKCEKKTSPIISQLFQMAIFCPSRFFFFFFFSNNLSFVPLAEKRWEKSLLIE